jgi:ribosome biogenesis GTPase A
MLRQQIYKVASRSKTSKFDIMVGVIGYPNVGKSSVINALAGRASAPVSPVSGHTKSIMNVRITERVMIIDSPGVIPVDEKDDVKLAIIASKNADTLKTPDLVAAQILWILLQQNGEKWFFDTFNVKVPAKANEANDLLDTLDAIAIFRKRLGKKGVADTLGMGRQIVMDWQRGKYQMVFSDSKADLNDPEDSDVV